MRVPKLMLTALTVLSTGVLLHCGSGRTSVDMGGIEELEAELRAFAGPCKPEQTEKINVCHKGKFTLCIGPEGFGDAALCDNDAGIETGHVCHGDTQGECAAAVVP
jgi:hypothetical protein